MAKDFCECGVIAKPRIAAIVAYCGLDSWQFSNVTSSFPPPLSSSSLLISRPFLSASHIPHTPPSTKILRNPSPIMSEPHPPVSFDESVYALSKVVHVVKDHNDMSDNLNDHQRKRLRLLNDIALLLVTESKSDVAAVSLERISSGVRFYYAKNRPETDDDRKHIKALRDLVSGAGDPTERIDQILYRVIDGCRPKLFSRLQKLKRTILENKASTGPYLFGDQDDELHEYYQINCDEWYDVYPTATEFLNDFLSELVNWDLAKSGSSVLVGLLRIAHLTGAYKQEPSPPPDRSASNNNPRPIFVDKELGQRMRLLGDYYGAAKRLVKHHDFPAARQSDKITIEFIPVSFHFLRADRLMDANMKRRHRSCLSR